MNEKIKAAASENQGVLSAAAASHSSGIAAALAQFLRALAASVQRAHHALARGDVTNFVRHWVSLLCSFYL
jgi:hypothetical protein